MVLKLKLKISKGTKPPTPGISEESKNEPYAKWISLCIKFHLVLMAWLFCRVFGLLGYGPFSVATRGVNIRDFEWNTSETLQIVFAVAVLQFDALVYVFLSCCNLSAEISQIKFDRTQMPFKYVQFCIPQILLGGLVLLQPQGFDFGLLFKMTLIWNTCSTLLVLIQSCIRLLKMKQILAKQVPRSTEKVDSDETPTVTVILPEDNGKQQLINFLLSLLQDCGYKYD